MEGAVVGVVSGGFGDVVDPRSRMVVFPTVIVVDLCMCECMCV